MLEAILESGRQALACDDYVITHAWNGEDSIRFTLSRRDPAAMMIKERIRIYETTGAQTYLVTGIDAGQTTVTYELKKDLSDWEKTVYTGYTNSTQSATAEDTIRGVLPAGWTLTCQETDPLSAYIALQGPTALDVVEHCREVFGCTVNFDTERKAAVLRFPAQVESGGAFLVETANLRAAPEYKSKAGGVITRLYAEGCEGMTFSPINGGKPYVECFDYTDELIAGYWRDERYTIPEHLLAAAQEKLRILSQPERSWELDVADLSAVDETRWPGMELRLYDVVQLIDPGLGQQMEVQITEVRACPHHPERNEISIENRNSSVRTLSAAVLIQRQRNGLYQDLALSMDQVKKDLSAAADEVETVRQTAASAQSAASNAQSTADTAQTAANTAQSAANTALTTVERIVNGTYSGGTFIDENRIYAPEIYAAEVKVINTSGSGMPTMGFYPMNGSTAMLSLYASPAAEGGSSMGGYYSTVSSPTDLALRSSRAIILSGTENPGPAGYTGVAVEGEFSVWGGPLTLKGNFLPSAENAYDIGSSDDRWRYIYSGTVNVAGNVRPEATGTRYLGLAAYRWKNIYTDAVNIGGNPAVAKRTKTVSGTTSANANISLGLNSNYGILSVRNTAANHVCIPYCTTGGAWYAKVAAISNLDPAANTAVTLEVDYYAK